MEELRSKRFVDQSPAQVYATLLDERKYLCSERTMCRILEKHGEVKERRKAYIWASVLTANLLTLARHRLKPAPA